jgi:hypothetical protein
MAFNRDLSQFAAYLDLDAAGNYIGITSQSETTNVGIGTATPTSKLQVQGDVLISGITTSTGGFVGDLTGNADTASALESSVTISLEGDVAGSISFDGSSNVSIAATIQPNSVSLGDDTTGNYVATIADAGNSNLTISNSGSENAEVTIDLADTTVSAGSYGSSSEIPTFTVDAKGRLTAAGTAAVSTGMTVTGDSGSEDIDLLTESLSISGGTNLTSVAANNGVTVNLDNDISLDNVNATGIITATGGFEGDLTGNADTATTLETSRTFEITGDVVASAISFDGSGNVSLAATIQPNSVSLGDDTTGNYVATIADAGNTNITVNNSGSETAAVTLDLTDTTVSAGSYGSSTEIPTFTVDTKGRLTAAGTASVGTALTVAGDSGSEVIDLLSETLTIAGGTNLTSSAASDTVTVNLDNDINLDNINATGIVTAAQFVTGASGEAIGISTNTISGPATLTIDPAAVGDDSGLVVIKGDLQVDGTQTIINSTTVTVNDKNIQIADGAANDAAADGAGITVSSGDGDKTFQFNDANDSFQSNISLDVASGEVYKIDGTEVLSADTLGSGVVNSSLTSVGTLGQLEVSGVSTFTSAIDADSGADIAGQTELDDVNVSGVATVNGRLTANGGVDLSGGLEVDQLLVTGVTTSTGGFDGDLTGNAGTATALETSRTFEITGDVVATAVSFDGTGNVSFAATIQPNSVALGDDTTGNYVATIADSGDSDVVVNNSGTETAAVTLGLTDTTVSAGSYGSATEIPTFTVDAKGRLTAAGTAAVSTGMTVAGDSGSEVIDLLSETLTIAGGTNLTSSAASDTVTINLDENISLTNVNASGVITASSGFVGDLTGDVTGNADTATALETARTFDITGDVVATAVSFDGTGNVSFAATIQPNSVALGDDTAGNYVATIADAGNTNITVNNSGTETADVTLDLTDTTVSAGSYGSATEIPTFTVDAKGRLTAAGTAAVSTGMTVAGDSGSEVIDLLSESLTIAGDTHVTTAAAADTVTISVDATSVNTNSTIVARDSSGGFAAGIVTATAVHLGDEGSAIRVTSDTISGPSTLNIDPSGVGDNSGTVVIKGDLQIDGTTTTVNSTTVTVDDKNITLASGAANDAAADGGGITVESGDGDKTFNWVDATDAWTSSEHMDLASGKEYHVNGTSVLSADTLGSGVVNSSLTSVGTLGQLEVTGVTTSTGGFVGNLTGNVDGNLNSSGLSTVTNLEVGGYISVGSTTGTSNQVMISTGVGVTWSTIADILPQTRTTDIQTATNGQTAFSFEYNVSYLDVFLNGVKLSSSDFTATNGSDITLSEAAFTGDKVEFISYATTGAGAGSVNSLNDLSDVTIASQSAGDILSYNGSGYVNQQTLNLSGIVTASAFYGDGSNLTGIDATALKDAGGNVKIQANESGAVLTGILTTTGAVNVGGNLTVTGDLTVDGTTTTINSTTLTVDDKNIVVASGAADANAADGAGLTVDGANATFTYAVTGDKFTSNKDIHAPNFNSTSDRNLKTDIRPVEGASELVGKLEGVHFAWKENGKETIGVIAQQIEEHLPQLVYDGEEYKSVNYNGLVGVLIEAVKEQGAQIAALKAEIEELKK